MPPPRNLALDPTYIQHYPFERKGPFFTGAMAQIKVAGTDNGRRISPWTFKTDRKRKSFNIGFAW